jgi:hypothetical protein
MIRTQYVRTLLVAAFSATTIALPAKASLISKLPGGANHAAAHAGAHRSQGAGVALGVLEPGPIPAANNLALNAAGAGIASRLAGQWQFGGRTPNANFPGDLSGTVTPFLGTPDDHMALVADTAAGGLSGGYIGVAPAATVYTGALGFSFFGPQTGPERDGDDPVHNGTFNSFRAAVDWMYTPLGGPVNAAFQHPRIALFNNSWGAGFEFNDNGTNRFAQFVDHYAATRDVLFVGAAGNNADNLLAAPNGPEQINWPWDAYNGITVGATRAPSGGNFTTRVGWSEYHLAGDSSANPDARGKPDILAPGVNIGDNLNDSMGNLRNEAGTSFAAPHVAGIAALLAAGTEFTGTGPQYPSLALGTAGATSRLAIKSIILNSARKRNINAPVNAQMTSLDYSGGLTSSYDLNNDGFLNDVVPRTDQEASDGDYLAGATLRAAIANSATLPNGQRTANWTPSAWSTDAAGRKLTVTAALDDEQGTGLADAKRALVQYDGGRQREAFFNAAGIGAIGWNTASLSATFGEDKYPFNMPMLSGTFITATLVWDNIVNEINAVGGGMGAVDDGDTYSAPLVPDFDLFIYRKLADGTFEKLAESIAPASGGNVEHLHFPIPNNGLAFDYEIRVDLLGGNPAFRDYSLAWWTTTIPEPNSAALAALALAFVSGRRRRRLRTR